MEHIAAFLLVLGCSDDLADCRELAPSMPLFESGEACDAALHEALQTFSNSYPQLLAQCLAVDPAIEGEKLELAWNIDAGGILHASIETPGIMVAGASKNSRLYRAVE